MHKWFAAIGNPPYQSNSTGNKKADESVYNYFMDAMYDCVDRVEFVTPARFLFDGGNTPSDWRKKMLSDPHVKVMDYEADSSKCFPNADIKGGVAITYRDINRNFGAIEHFTPFPELNTILRKVLKVGELSIMSIIHNQDKFNLEILYNDFPSLANVISSDGHEKRLTSGCLVYDCFHDEKTDNDVKILGVIKNKRTYRYISRKYIDDDTNIDKYKVIVPANNGSGALGEVVSTPLIGTPLIGITQTFITFGAFDNQQSAESCLKYIKSKFCRVLLGVLKITQNGKKPVWKYVPLQDFTADSDIDWSQSVADIDKQLYKKYGLSDDEIEFIESHVKEME